MNDILEFCLAALFLGVLLFAGTYLFVYIDYRYKTACAKDICKYSAEYNTKAAKEILQDHPNAKIVL